MFLSNFLHFLSDDEVRAERALGESGKKVADGEDEGGKNKVASGKDEGGKNKLASGEDEGGKNNVTGGKDKSSENNDSKRVSGKESEGRQERTPLISEYERTKEINKQKNAELFEELGLGKAVEDLMKETNNSNARKSSKGDEEKVAGKRRGSTKKAKRK